MSFRVIEWSGTKMEYKAQSGTLRQVFDYLKIGAAAGIIAAAPVMAQDAGLQETNLTQAQIDGLLIARYLSGDPQGTLEVKSNEIVLEYREGKSVSIVSIEYINLPTQEDKGHGEIRVYFKERDKERYIVLYKAVDLGSLTSMGQDVDVSGIERFGDIDKGYVGGPGVGSRFMEGFTDRDPHSQDHQGTLESVYATAAAQVRAKIDSVNTSRQERAKRFEVFRPQQSR